MKKFLLLIIAAMFCLGSTAQKGWTYTYVNVDYTIDIKEDGMFSPLGKYRCSWKGVKLTLEHGKAAGEIIVPSTVKFKGKTENVVEVEYHYEMKREGKITKLVLPSTVKYVHGLWRTSGVKEVVLSEGLQEIGMYCFDFHGKNTIKIKIPASVVKIGKEAFNGSAVEVEFSPNSKLRWIEDYAFFGASFSTGTTLKLPSNLILIGSGAFKGTKLEGVEFPKGLKTIGAYAFAGNDLREINIPNSVKYIGVHAFERNPHLTRAILPNDEIYTDYYSEVFENTDLRIVITHNSQEPPKSLINKYKRSLKEFSNYNSRYDVYDVFGENCPYKSVADSFAKSFRYYAKDKIPQLEKKLEAWQKRGEFETTQQYESRVTENARNTIVEAFMDSVKQTFFKEWKKDSGLTYTLGSYDADSGIYTLNGKNGEEPIHVKVPVSEAPMFKTSFSPQKSVENVYGVVNDRMAVVGIKCVVSGKEYPITNTYEKEDKLLALDLPPLKLDFGDSNTATSSKPQTPTDRTIDQNIPVSNVTNSNTFAVIIGNEDYKNVSKVQYAQNDARSFAEYCKKTLGLPEKNVRGYEDATYGMMVSALQDIQKIAKAYHGDINIIFYYAGHGIPDNASKNAYLLPVDADGRQMDICFPLDKLYQELGALEAKSVTVFLDACFSGALRGDGMLMAARTVALKPKPSTPQGKMVVFSAATDEQTAFPYTEKGHGMFTYYLLKKIRDTKGNCTLGELGTYICDEVAKQSIVTNGREQTPTVRSSASIAGSWKGLKLK